MSERAVFSADGALAATFAAIGVVVMVGSMKLGFGKLDLPGAGLFPFFTGLTIFLGSVAVMAALTLSAKLPGDPMFEAGGARTLAFLIVIFAAWVLVLPAIGFVLGTFVCVLAFAKVLRLEGFIKPLLLALATSVSVYVMFQHLLQLDLPSGPLG